MSRDLMLSPLWDRWTCFLEALHFVPQDLEDISVQDQVV